jgi:hypothetical protein
MVLDLFRRDMDRLPAAHMYQYVVAIYIETELYWHFVREGRDCRHARDLAIAAIPQPEWGLAEICVVGLCTDRICPAYGKVEDRTFFEIIDTDGKLPR